MIQILRHQHKIFLSELKKSGKANATLLAYGKDIEQMIEYFEKNSVGEATLEGLENFKQHLLDHRYTNKSVIRKINSIKAFFRFLHNSGIIQSNPTTMVSSLTSEQAAPRILKKLEYRALRDACRRDKRISTIVELLLQTGLRISELANLKVPDVDLEKHALLVREFESRPPRTVPLNNAAINTLKEYLTIRPKTKEQTLFLTKTCRPFLVRNIRTSIDRYFRIAGIPNAKVNDLRHTFITEQLSAGVPLIYVSQLVGHKRITTTERYLKLIDKSGNTPPIRIEEL